MVVEVAACSLTLEEPPMAGLGLSSGGWWCGSGGGGGGGGDRRGV